MPPVDLAPPPAAVRPEPARLRGWGGGPGVTGWLVRAERDESLSAGLEQYRARPGAWTGVLARGMGRSYGDAAQLGGGLLLETRRLRGFDLDREAGTVTAQAGATIGELLSAVVPGAAMCRRSAC